MEKNLILLKLLKKKVKQNKYIKLCIKFHKH